MGCCSPKCQQISTFTIAAILLGLGISLAILWDNLFINIRNKQLSVGSTDTQGFKMWKETPIPMYMEFYLFNWTNAEAFRDNKWSTKPILEECGPYTYSEHHIREQLVFNENNTITYKTRKVWKFLPDKSKGKLDDKITTINVILAAVADTVKNKNIIVKEGIDFFIKEKGEDLILTRTAEEFIFKGYKDPFIELAHKLHIKGLDIPFDKFGWFYDRNNSVDYDGILNMYNGVEDINKLGVMHSWNFKSQLDYYPGECGKVRGTSGELWYPPKEDEILEVFSPDICGTIKIRKNSTILHYGIKGNKYVATPEIFDYNKTENLCYLPDGVNNMHNGVRSVQKCKFNAPAYVSFPHFYTADPFYYSNIIGMKPDPAEHHFYIALEPTTGLPLRVHAALQVNILLQNVKGISCLKNVKNTYFPMLWFKQTAELTEELSSLGKMLLIMPAVGTYTAYGIISFGALLLMIGFYLMFKKGWKSINEEEQLLNQQQTFN